MDILTRPEAAEFLRIPLHSLNFLVSTNQIPYSRLGRRRIVFLRDRLIEYVRERENVEYRMPRGGIS